MPAPDTNTKALAAAAALAVIAGVAAGLLVPAKPDGTTTRHLAVSKKAPTAASRCFDVDVLASSGARALFGVSTDSGLDEHFTVTMRYEPGPDGGSGTAVVLPAGFDIIDSTHRNDRACPAAPELEAWPMAEAASTTLYDCACGPGCERLVTAIDGTAAWLPGVLNLTYGAGMWRTTDGGACIRKPCTELSGRASSMPAACTGP